MAGLTFIPLVFGLSAQLSQLELSSYLRDPTKITNTQYNVCRGLGLDGALSYLDDDAEIDALGLRRQTSDYSLPADATADVEKKGRIAVALEVARRLKIMRTDNLKVVATMSGPTKLGAKVWGPEFLGALRRHDNSAVAGFDLLSQVLVKIARAHCEVEPDLLMIMESPDCPRSAPWYLDFLSSVCGVARYFNVKTVLHQNGEPEVMPDELDCVVIPLNSAAKSAPEVPEGAMVGLAVEKAFMVSNPQGAAEAVRALAGSHSNRDVLITTDEELTGVSYTVLKEFTERLRTN